jgi:hypothetical protein
MKLTPGGDVLLGVVDEAFTFTLNPTSRVRWYTTCQVVYLEKYLETNYIKLCTKIVIFWQHYLIWTMKQLASKNLHLKSCQKQCVLPSFAISFKINVFEIARLV